MIIIIIIVVRCCVTLKNENNINYYEKVSVSMRITYNIGGRVGSTVEIILLFTAKRNGLWKNVQFIN